MHTARPEITGSLLAALLALSTALSAAEDPGTLLETLSNPNATPFDKAKACQRLAVIGTREAVPALVALLENDQLAHYARFALEPIPDSSVDDALRGALARLKGRLLIGVINSIGIRRDVKAVEALTKLLGDPETEEARAAAAALGRIGTTECAKTLQQTLGGAAPASRAPYAEACLVCAERLLVSNRRDDAVGLYDVVRKADLPAHIQAAGLRGAIVAREAEGLPILVEVLQSGDGYAFTAGLGLARELRGGEVTEALVKSLGKLTPERQGLLLAALADRGDKAALPAVLEAARGVAPEPRAAAVRAIGKLGDVTAVPVLLDAAVGDVSLSSTALETLETLGGKEVDAAIVSRLHDADSRLRPVLIDLAGRRRIAASVPALRKSADSTDDAVRLPAIRALGMTVGVDDLPFLVDRYLAPTSETEGAAVSSALKVAVQRLPDKDASAGKVLVEMDKASPGAKLKLLSLLGNVGGRRALEAVGAAARAPVADLRVAATQTLAGWQTEDAAPELLALTRESPDAEYRLAALAGFKRIVGGLRFAKEERLKLCQSAMQIARTDPERRVVIETYAAIPALETLPLLVPFYANAALKDDACGAAVTIGERILRYNAAPVREAMKKVVEAGARKEILDRAQAILRQGGEK